MASSDIVGYVDPLISYSGDKPAVKVSCSRKHFTSKVFRLGAGYEHPNAPPVSHQLVHEIPEQTHGGVPQFTRIGSFARVSSWHDIDLDTVDEISFSFAFQATLPSGAGHKQVLFSSMDFERGTGFECTLDEDSKLFFRTGSPKGVQQIKFPPVIARHRWYDLRLVVKPCSGIMTLNLSGTPRDIGEDLWRYDNRFDFKLIRPACIASTKPLTIAGDSRDIGPSAQPITSSTFNGKLDGFKIQTQSKGKIHTVLDFDFSLDIPTDIIRGKSHDIHGITINGPSRAVTGHDWDASQTDWTKASYGYGAIHFHDDDLDDAGWNTSFELELPKNLRSGCYAVFVDDGESTDFIPFFVKPDPVAKKVPPVALIIPTFTYAAYANEHLHDERRAVHFPGDSSKMDKYFRTLMKRPDLGISLYDSHNDGSGTCFSTIKRPILNMRPDYSMWLFDGPREFPADLWFVDFLDRELGAEGYDVITDHQISEHGAPLLMQYKVLMSCSHPEYPTFNMLNSYSRFLQSGGHFMYLGGNGYYWVTSHDSTRPHRIEVRRAEAGCRTFSLPPGSHHHSLTGELGGLWRSRGRPPNRLFGIGSCAMGVGKGTGYGITEEARSHPRLSKFLQGLKSDSIIGDFGLVQGAASGDEIDRLDYELGTPHNAILVATSKLAGGHSNEYHLFNEETLFPMVNTTGTTSDKIRSDIVFFETAKKGAVFSVGSINWVGALAWNTFNNNVARLTANVLHDFIRENKC
ncbi:MAG: hypothetical protein LQ352_007593 [Teloschistes flavicans]|nr:MAG: hypothetical protein LQ352_007593 [Teloschistes flavicans]